MTKTKTTENSEAPIRRGSGPKKRSVSVTVRLSEDEYQDISSVPVDMATTIRKCIKAGLPQVKRDLLAELQRAIGRQ